VCRVLLRRKNHERGAAAVEFALVSLIFVTLVGVVFQFAIYLWAFQAASNGAREGARAWAVDPCGSWQLAKVEAAVAPAAAPGTVSASSDLGASPTPGDTVTVTVTMKPRAIGFNLVPGLDFNDFITKTATARVEGNDGC
jgi:Flp pilus assembly pilin Flp